MSVLIWKPGLNDGSQGEMPNTGMGILAAEFKRCGHDVTILDQHLVGDIPKINRAVFIDNDFEWVAVSLVSEEWLNPMTIATMNWAKGTGAKVMVGGPHAGAYTEMLEKEKCIDKIVIGEIDHCLPEVFATESKVVRLGQAQTLQTPDYTDLIGKDRVFAYPLYTSRGCTNRCSFCAGASVHKKFRTRALDLEFWKEIYDVPRKFPNVRLIHVIDDCFTGDLDHAKRFLEGYSLLKGFHIPLHIINVRADQLDDEVLKLMYLCGVRELPIGVESGDGMVYREIGKNESLYTIERGIKKIQKAGITPWLNMIVGLPGDNMFRAMNSAHWAKSQPDPKVIHWFMYAPFRGTRAYSQLVQEEVIDDGFIPKAYGRRYDDWPWYPGFDYPYFSRWEMGRAQLYSYLVCLSPILINDPDIEKKCIHEGLEEEYRYWLDHAPIKSYLAKHQPFKKEKGQI